MADPLDPQHADGAPPPPDAPPPADPPPVAPPAAGAPRWLVALVVGLVVALVGTAALAGVQTARLSDERAEAAALRAQVEDLEARVDELESDPLGALLEGGLEGLLGGALGEGGLGDLLSEGGLGDLLGGALGDGGLDGLLGEGGLLDPGGAVPQLQGCTTGVPDLPDVDAGADLDVQLDAVADVVGTLRGLTSEAPIEPVLRTQAEIREVLAAEVADAYPAGEADEDRRILAALQAVPADIDLIDVQTALLGDQVAGYYDDETRELVVRAETADASLGGSGLIALAHELDHALVDAAIGLPPLDEFGDDEDAALAALAVVEGSAVATQTQFQRSALDPLALLGDLGELAASGAGLESVPAFIRESLTFPYVAGASWACGLHGDGGWDAVDAALADPPPSSHAILFGGDLVPEQLDDIPEGPRGYARQTTRTFGAAPLNWLLAAPADDPSLALDDPVAAVEPWRGGHVLLWTRGDASAVSLLLTGEALCEPVAEWWRRAAGGPTEPTRGDEVVAQQTADGTWGVVRCTGASVDVGIGPDLATARAALS